MKRLEPAGLVLQRAQPQQVVDALLDGLDGAVEHRAVRAQAHAVRGAVHLQPLVAGALVVADLLAHARREDLGAAARQRVEPGLAQPAQHLGDRHAEVLVEEEDLDRREGLEVDATA